MKLEGYNESRRSYLIKSSKWSGRTFKPLSELIALKEKGALNCEKPLSYHYSDMLQSLGTTEFEEIFLSHWDKDVVARLLLQYSGPHIGYQDAFDAHFCEEMFIPIPRKPKSPLKREAVAERPNRPDLSNDLATGILKRSKWLHREFKGTGLLINSDLHNKIHPNLWTYLCDSRGPTRSLCDSMDNLRNTPITWNGIIADLSWNDLISPSYSVHTFDIGFTEDMFIPLPAKKKKGPSDPRDLFKVEVDPDQDQVAIFDTQAIKQRINQLSEDDDYYLTLL